jgi:5-methylcytosine-specific restriction endonuclease McrA
MMASALSEMTNFMLQQRVLELRQRERKLMVELLVHLAELERRRLYFEMGHDSLFKLLNEGLGYSKGSSYRRMIGARLCVRFPQVVHALREGMLNLAQICALHEILTEDNVEQELREAVGKSEDVLRAIVAGRQGKPVATSSVRVVHIAPRLDLPLASTASPTEAPATSGQGEHAAMTRIEPVMDELHELKLIVDKRFMDDFNAVRDALSHKIPDRDLTEVMHECMRMTLDVIRKRQEGAGRATTRPSTPPKEGARRVPTPVRREVMVRDGRRCAYVGPDGTRCNSTYQIQLHHVAPFAAGGPATVENLEVRCRRHNHMHARQELGERFIARAIDRSQLRARAGSARTGSAPAGSARTESAPAGSARTGSRGSDSTPPPSPPSPPPPSLRAPSRPPWPTS